MTLRNRILAALQLAPMSIAELSRCLSASASGIRHAADDLRATGEIRKVEPVRVRRMGRPGLRFAV